MRYLVFLATISLTATAIVSAQQPAAPAPSAQSLKTFATSAEVAALIAKAKADIKPGQSAMGESILQLAPYNLDIEYRVAVGKAALHEHEAELLYVLEGAATMTIGGQLTNATRTNADNLNGTGITGGVSQHVTKGDFILIPDGTPHWFNVIDTNPLVLMSLHLPRPARATP